MAEEIDGLVGLKVPTDRGPLLDGVLFNGTASSADTVLLAITGIHGSFYSNPFYINFGQTLNVTWADAEANPLYPVPVVWCRLDFERLIAQLR